MIRKSTHSIISKLQPNGLDIADIIASSKGNLPKWR